ncbi:hypothetical protein U0070_006477 [Myodes glareolus]|uniref:Uncharacterized protein n=1 Tax=Myodes glareolus TaxID=447135 RepID=A0AAW0HSD0_MYOGA
MTRHYRGCAGVQQGGQSVRSFPRYSEVFPGLLSRSPQTMILLGKGGIGHPVVLAWEPQDQMVYPDWTAASHLQQSLRHLQPYPEGPPRCDIIHWAPGLQRSPLDMCLGKIVAGQNGP